MAIDGGPQFQFVLEYPRLYSEAHKEVCKIIERTVEEKSAVLKYEGGAEAVLSVSDGTIRIKFAGVPKEVKTFQCLMLININFSNGGTWKMDAGEAKPFPSDFGEKPQFYQGHARTFTISNSGQSVSITVPEFSYLELTDNRAWNWKIFAFKATCPFNAANPVATIQIQPAETEGTPVGAAERKTEPQVDALGQSTKRDWPEKMKTVDELKADAVSEKEYYGKFTPPSLDHYGGLPDGKKNGFSSTGFFHVEKKDGKWFLINPDGNLFFHLGVCCFSPQTYTYTGGRREIYEWLPPHTGEFASAFLKGADPDNFSFHEANYIRKFGKPVDRNEWTLLMIERVRKWGFNSGGSFTSRTDAFTQAKFPYVLTLPGGAGNVRLLPGDCRVADPFEEKTWTKIESLYAAQVAPVANDPLLIGYFIENEPLYEDVPRIVPSLKASQFACKRRLVEFLQETYPTIDAFNTAWKMTAKSFDDLREQGLPVTSPAAIADMRRYTEFFLDTYFQKISQAFRKHDPNHLLLGSRLQHGTINNETLCRIMGKYLDIVSFNYYTYGIDPDFLKQIHTWTGGKPMLLSEFYWASPKESGLPGGVRDVSSLEERGLAYRNYVEQAAGLGFVVGIEWFTLIDQPLTGNWFSKYNGENGNTGLISVTDRPWKATVAEMAKTNHDIYSVVLGNCKPFVYANPRYQMSQAVDKMLKVARALGPVTVNGKTENWPGLPAEALGKRLVQGADAGAIDATFKACWDDSNFYIVATITDPTPMKNEHTGGNLWKGDGLEIFFSTPTTLKETGAMLATDRQVLIGGSGVDGKPRVQIVNQPGTPEIPAVVVPNVDGKSYTVQAAIPFSALGFTPREGDVIRFDLAVNDSEDGKQRTRQFMWNGTDKNSRERKGWGQATFIR